MRQSMDKTSLGDRMKEYENAYKFSFPKRMPIIVRVDGKAFHTFTRKFDKPFDTNLISMMNETALYMLNNIQGAELAYIQSDEISILIHYYKTIDSEPWFANELQKIVSVSAALASSQFTYSLNSLRYFDFARGPIQFDSRAFVLPEDEVCNYFLWRQLDWTRNSVQMFASSLYSHKELHKKNVSMMQDMIIEKGRNWNNLDTSLKRGRCAIKADYGIYIDNEIPIFTQDRDYINKHLYKE
jgi:tRNA(His) 5'-end guanylyltransferase